MTLKDKKILPYISDICRSRRIELDMTLKEVAIDNGCTLQNISDFERGKNNSATILYYYITELGVNLK